MANGTRLEPGPRNAITDIPGLLVGQAGDATLKTGVSVLFGETPFVAAVDVMGGAPGTRETDCLAPDALVDRVDAIVLSGGSAFGLAAAGAVCDGLRARGRGFPVGPVRVPIVPGAILFDRLAGGANDWAADATANPWLALGRQALDGVGVDVALGSVGAGTGATTATLKGGLGSASLRLPDGSTVGALVAANPNGSAVHAESGRFHAWQSEIGGEYGGLGPPPSPEPPIRPPNEKLAGYERQLAGAHTTLAIVATDRVLDKAACKRLATAAQDGMARALWPSHTPIDGDIVFAVSTRPREAGPRRAGPSPREAADPGEALLLGHAAAVCVSRAIARAVWHATPAPNDILPTWQARYGGGA